MTAFLRGRTALLAAALVGAFLAPPGAAAQSDGEIVRSLLGRIESADERLKEAVNAKLDAGNPVSREEVQTLFVRGFEYFRARDYYTASSLFVVGLVAWDDMGWPENDTVARARFYDLVARKRFCVDAEPAKCEASYRYNGGRRSYLDVISDIQLYLSREEAFPAELRAEAKRECRSALEKLRALCRADRSGSNACKNISPC